MRPSKSPMPSTVFSTVRAIGATVPDWFFGSVLFGLEMPVQVHRPQVCKCVPANLQCRQLFFQQCVLSEQLFQIGFSEVSYLVLKCQSKFIGRRFANASQQISNAVNCFFNSACYRSNCSRLVFRKCLIWS